MKNPLRHPPFAPRGFCREVARRCETAMLRRLDELEKQTGEQSRCLEVFTFMKWIRHATISTTPLISVVLPTRNRRERLEHAVASVVCQTYSNWQLVVVDDGSIDTTSEFLAGIDDERIRSVRARGVGICAARNIALGRDGGRTHRLSRR